MATKDISDRTVCLAYEQVRLRKIAFDNDCLKNVKTIMEAVGKFKTALLCEYPYEILQKMTGQPAKVCYSAMERAAGRGYIEYGVSLRTGWLTGKGKELLKKDICCPKCNTKLIVCNMGAWEEENGLPVAIHCIECFVFGEIFFTRGNNDIKILRQLDQFAIGRYKNIHESFALFKNNQER